jgi:hypothetical protein
MRVQGRKSSRRGGVQSGMGLINLNFILDVDEQERYAFDVRM